ncbi:MAG: EFR1 family ferrodoxin [Prolixibacteraceae bacterium]|nr:EFR1 family ferrodoxin [Prolixibacteraceae bacterium]MBN2775247.1 EFR1 family ferrodoxin [Prolixibacteraceae bacterium]
MYSNLIIYYFTGTGNALAVANWIAGYFSKKGIPSQIIKIEKNKIPEIDAISESTLIGFCYPTHGFNAPPVVLDFLRKLPRRKGIKVFLANTRAGMKISKIFTPGLSGLAQICPALMLWLKGYKIIGFRPVDLPSNWISLHPGLRQKVVFSIFLRCERIVKRFSEKIYSGKKVYRGLFDLPLDLVVSPVSLGYFFYGRFALGKTFIANHKCNSCGLCIKQCPVGAIGFKQGRPFWSSKCESCMQCMNSCPKRAIETAHLLTALLWWLVFSLIPVTITSYLAHDGNFFSQHYTLIVWIIIFTFGLPVIFRGYKIFHFLMKYKFFSSLIVYTSLTRFKFWRRYYAPKKYLKQSHSS